MEKIKIVYKKVSELIPYEKNPRKNDNAVDVVANSIKEFGFKVPCVVTENGTLVTGHTRLKACLKLGIKEVPCIIASDLTDTQIKQFRLADNKVSEFAKWDDDLLQQALAEIDLDLDADFSMEDFGFKMDDYFEDKEAKYEEETLERTSNMFNIGTALFEGEGKFGIPKIEKCEVIEDTKFIRFDEVLTCDAPNGKSVHFFLDDYKFERVWNQPDKYMFYLTQFDYVASPDFSMYIDMPIAIQLFNHYRSHWVGAYMNKNGIKVIPTVSWSTPDSYEWCFDGMPEGGTSIVSTVGVLRKEESFNIWKDGMAEFIKRKHPEQIIIYGKPIDFDFGDIKLMYVENHSEDIKRKMKSE